MGNRNLIASDVAKCYILPVVLGIVAIGGRAVAEKTRIIVDVTVDMVAWIDEEAAKRDRSRSWMLQESLRQWRRRLESERKRRERARRNRAG